MKHKGTWYKSYFSKCLILWATDERICSKFKTRDKFVFK